MALTNIPRSTTATEGRVTTYGPNTAQIELLLDGIAHAQQLDLWSIGCTSPPACRRPGP